MADATQQVIDLYGGAVVPAAQGVTVRDAAKLRSAATDRLVWQAVFGSGDEREAARWLLWELGQVDGRAPGLDQRAVHGTRPRRRRRVHGAGDERPR